MKIDTTEMQRIVDTTGTGRMHLYTTIHKALRARMSTVLVKVGQMDAGDDLHCREVVSELEQLLDVLQGHLETENEWVHPAIEARNPGALTDIVADHAAHESAIGQLHHHAQTVLTLSGENRAAFILFLYREFALFVADNLTHMHVEETQNHQLLWSTHSDLELRAIHSAILASLPPEKMAVILPWMISAISHAERTEMFLEMYATAPAFVFEGALDVARSCLSGREWGKLSSRLGMGQVPGLVAFTPN